VNDIWGLTDAVLLTTGRERQEKERPGSTRCSEKEQQQSTKENGKFLLAYEKYNDNNNLLSEDLNALSKRVQEKNDAPLQSNVSELRTQREHRKHR
jgi:hypothetical protein